MFYALQLLAQGPADPNQNTNQGGGGSPWGNPLLLIPVFLLIFYFTMIRPKQRVEREHQKRLRELKKNDKVVTSGGIIGIVASIKEKEDELTLKVDENSNVRLRVTKSSVVQILSGEEPAKEQKEAKT